MWFPAVVATAPTAMLVADAVTSDNPLQSWLSYGAVGAVAIALAIGLLVPKPTHDRTVQALADTQARLTALQDKTDERVLPALVKNSLVLEALTPLLQHELVIRRAAGGE